jgi:hypothetical protein
MRNGLASAVTRVFPCFDRRSRMRLRVGSASAKNTAVILSRCLATRLTIRYLIMSSKVNRKGKYPRDASAREFTAASAQQTPRLNARIDRLALKCQRPKDAFMNSWKIDGRSCAGEATDRLPVTQASITGAQ